MSNATKSPHSISAARVSKNPRKEHSPEALLQTSSRDRASAGTIPLTAPPPAAPQVSAAK
eukprot:11625389-Alexandrium_andersonii.AAC.1